MAATEAVLNTLNQCAWDYAGLAHAAHLAGSPGNLIKTVSSSAEAAGYAAGLAKGTAKAGPIGFALGAAVVLGAGYVYLKYKGEMAVYKAAKARSVAAANAYVDETEANARDPEADKEVWVIAIG